mgnify:FL=1
MATKSKIFRTAAAVFCMVSMLFFSILEPTHLYASSDYGFVLLSTYSVQMKVGDSFYLAAITSNGKRPKFSSSNTKVASVNTYGKITAKKAGTATITAKTSNGEAGCKVVVEKTSIQLSKTRITLDNGYSIQLKATTSTGHAVTWKSDKTSIVAIDERGWITAKKPGRATITASVDGSRASCVVTVRKPELTLNKTKVSLFRKQQVKLTASCTSSSKVKWKSNKRSVAVVDEKGLVTAVKNGTAVITATVDGVSKTCEVTVKKPAISFEQSEMSLAVGETKKLRVTVSSGNKPTYSSSNSDIVSVDENGKIYGKYAGHAYIYAKEDGSKARIYITVK